MIRKSAALLLLTTGTALAADGTIHFNHIGGHYLDSDLDGISGDGFGLDLSVALTRNVFVAAEYSTRDYDDAGTELEFFSGGLGGNYPLTESGNIQLFGGLSWEQVDVSFAGGGGGGGGGDGGGDGGDGGDGGGDDGGGGDDPGIPTCAPPEVPLIGGQCLPGGGAGGKAFSSKAVTIGARDDGYGAQLGIRALVMPALEVNARYRMRDYSDSDTDESIISLGAAYSVGSWAFGLSYDSYDEFEIDEFYAGVRYVFGTDEGGGSIW